MKKHTIGDLISAVIGVGTFMWIILATTYEYLIIGD